MHIVCTNLLLYLLIFHYYQLYAAITKQLKYAAAFERVWKLCAHCSRLVSYSFNGRAEEQEEKTEAKQV